jgi:hypothetical protein
VLPGGVVLLFNEGTWPWFLVVFLCLSAVSVGFWIRRYSRILKITYPDQPPPHAPPQGSEDAEFDQEQRDKWEREHPDWPTGHAARTTNRRNPRQREDRGVRAVVTGWIVIRGACQLAQSHH